MLLANDIQTAVACYLEKPGLDRFVSLDDGQRKKELKKYLLENITRMVIITQEMINKVKEGSAIAMNQRFKCFL
jgi:hypothetical protein